MLGWCYDYGIGTLPDFSKAKEWYRKSAESGNPEAKSMLTLLEKIKSMDSNESTNLKTGKSPKGKNTNIKSSSHQQTRRKDANKAKLSASPLPPMFAGNPF